MIIEYNPEKMFYKVDNGKNKVILTPEQVMIAEKYVRKKIYNQIIESTCHICPYHNLKYCKGFECNMHNILAIVDGERWYTEINENPRYKIWCETKYTDDEQGGE